VSYNGSRNAPMVLAMFSRIACVTESVGGFHLLE